MTLYQIAVITAALRALSECLDRAYHEKSSQGPVDVLDVFLIGSVPYSRFGELFNELIKMLWVPDGLLSAKVVVHSRSKQGRQK